MRSFFMLLLFFHFTFFPLSFLLNARFSFTHGHPNVIQSPRNRMFAVSAIELPWQVRFFIMMITVINIGAMLIVLPIILLLFVLFFACDLVWMSAARIFALLHKCMRSYWNWQRKQRLASWSVFFFSFSRCLDEGMNRVSFAIFSHQKVYSANIMRFICIAVRFYFMLPFF